MDVEHLWFSNQPSNRGSSHFSQPINIENRVEQEEEEEEEQMVQTLANMADKRLYKLVKWCKSLPLFKNILVSVQYHKTFSARDIMHFTHLRRSPGQQAGCVV